MTTHKNLYAALAAAQAEMGPALKDAVNPAFKSKYADLASVMAACMPALNKHGIALLQPTYDDEGGMYVKTMLVHGESGETAECRTRLIIGKNDMQGYGSAITYARRYGLMGMVGIAPEDDDGNDAARAAPKEPSMAHMKRQLEKFNSELLDCHTLVALETLKAQWVETMDKEGWPPADKYGDPSQSYRGQASAAYKRRKITIENEMEVEQEAAE